MHDGNENVGHSDLKFVPEQKKHLYMLKAKLFWKEQKNAILQTMSRFSK